MAKPLALVLKPQEISGTRDLRDDLQRKLAEAPVEHAAALLSLYELIQKLHESGTLDLLRGFFGAQDEITAKVSSALSSPEATRLIRNVIALAQMLGKIDPEVFEDLRDAAIETGEKNRTAAGHRPPGLWAILRRTDSEDSLRALAAATNFLESFGRRIGRDAHGNGSGH